MARNLWAVDWRGGGGVALVLAIAAAVRRYERNVVVDDEARSTARRVKTTARDLPPEAKELLRELEPSGRHLQVERDLPHGRFVVVLGPRGHNTDYARDDDPRFQQRYLEALELLDDHGCLNDTHEGYFISDHGRLVLDYLSRSLAGRLLPWR